MEVKILPSENGHPVITKQILTKGKRKGKSCSRMLSREKHIQHLQGGEEN